MIAVSFLLYQKSCFITQLPCSLEPEFLHLFVQPVEVCWDISLFDLLVSFVSGWNGPGMVCSRLLFSFLEGLVEGFVLLESGSLAASEVCPAARCAPTRAGGPVSLHTRGLRALPRPRGGLPDGPSSLFIEAPADVLTYWLFGPQPVSFPVFPHRGAEPLGQMEREARSGLVFVGTGLTKAGEVQGAAEQKSLSKKIPACSLSLSVPLS